MITAEPHIERATDPAESGVAVARAVRLQTMAADNFQFIWRSLRRLGLPADAVDDAAQEVFVTAARRLDDIEPGRERAFLYMTAVRVAAAARRHVASRREASDENALDQEPDSDETRPDELLEARRARALLDRVLDALPDDLRAVFVLFELEGLASAEIADLLGVPVGTVASRLRRAREAFHTTARRLRARASGGPR